MDGQPIVQIEDNSKKMIKVAAVGATFYDDKRYSRLIREGYLVLGISSFGNYPIYNPYDAKNDISLNEISKRHMQIMINDIKGWLTCSINSDQYPNNVPKLAYAEADSPFDSEIKNRIKKYDIATSCGCSSEWC